MKVVLFCGGLGTRIREYSESVPKPMIPVGHQPILWHIMQYYSHFGHNDFVLCLGYKANTIKQFFLDYRPQSFGDCVVSQYGTEVRTLGPTPPDWRVSMVDTGLWRNIGERLWAVRHHVQNEEMFLANYSDGLTDVNLDAVVEKFRASGKLACFLAVRPQLSLHFADIADCGRVNDIRTSRDLDMWINGGYFILKPEVFSYMREGEELVEAPFRRLIEKDLLMAWKHEGFWRAMDTLKDKQFFEDMVEHGKMPWRINGHANGNGAGGGHDLSRQPR